MLDYYRRMIDDTARTGAYRDALTRAIAPGSVVVDVGTGTGILALLACAAGARRVFAIEKRHAADAARLVARRLGYAEQMTVLHQHSRDVELPEPADVLVTETLGMLGFDEGILGIVLDAAPRFLRPGGMVIPQRVAVHLAPVELPAEYDAQIAWWSERRFGFDLSSLRMFASNTLYPATVRRDSFLAAPAAVIDAELATLTVPRVHGTGSYVATRAGTLHGFAGWFKAVLIPGVDVSNEPEGATGWSQALLPLIHPIEVVAGSRITVELDCHDGALWRWHGAVDSPQPARFDQSTAFSQPPCMLHAE